MYHQRDETSVTNNSDSDETSNNQESPNNLFDLDINKIIQNDCDSSESEEKPASEKNALQKLQMVKLDFISIPPTTVHAQQIVNLRQSFTFPFELKKSKEIATQTSQMNLVSCFDQKSSQYLRKRPASLPPENAALINLEKIVDLKAKSFEENIGDGLNVDDRKINVRKPDLELADCISPSGVQCVLMKPK